ncbi:hypothetical protein GGE07_006009 [Sinorhizobium terangae]|nr:hypothetical protein [Sinorhizobium terangae]
MGNQERRGAHPRSSTDLMGATGIPRSVILGLDPKIQNRVTAYVQGAICCPCSDPLVKPEDDGR